MLAAVRNGALGRLARGGSRQASTAASETIKTAVYDDHVAQGGKMVDFAGYFLPLQYPSGVKKECEHTRQAASLFDVSHMGQIQVHGADRVKFIEKLVVGDIAALSEGSSQLSVITNEKGGIIDDTVITMESNNVAMVLNGACKHKDLAHMKEQLAASPGLDVHIEHLEDLALFALQGPKAAAVLEGLVEGVDIKSMLFMTSKAATIGGLKCTLTRCGYTGEDGFEISVTNGDASTVMGMLLENKDVAPAGLGARDTLRIEAGLCLYGVDIDDTTTPIEAGLNWTIGKRRRAEGGFLGADVILDQLNNKTWTRKRVGMLIDGPPARAHVELFAASDPEGESVGEILSGTFSPTLAKPIAIGYVTKGNTKNGTALLAKVRNRMVPATVTKMPFVPASYYRGQA